jgi:hypothetical protein
MSHHRYSRNEGLFGKAGQDRIGETVVGIAGYGGLGSIIGTLLAYLGVLHYRIVEFDPVEWPNLNRQLGATPDDVGQPKADIADRTIRAIQTDADIRIAPERFGGDRSLDLLSEVDVLFGCVDKDPVRLALLDWASSRSIPYIDTATDVIITPDSPIVYGGRVVVSTGDGCPLCLDVLDQRDLALDAMTPDQREAYARTYGIDVAALGHTGPSVVSLNGVVASLAVTEFMVLVTGLRPPARLLTYRADQGHVRLDRTEAPEGCIYCSRYQSL